MTSNLLPSSHSQCWDSRHGPPWLVFVMPRIQIQSFICAGHLLYQLSYTSTLTSTFWEYKTCIRQIENINANALMLKTQEESWDFRSLSHHTTGSVTAVLRKIKCAESIMKQHTAITNSKTTTGPERRLKPAKPDVLSLIPGTFMVGKEKRLTEAILWSVYAHEYVHACSHSERVWDRENKWVNKCKEEEEKRRGSAVKNAWCSSPEPAWFPVLTWAGCDL